MSLIPKKVQDVLILLDQGLDPRVVADLVPCSVSYVYLVRKDYRPKPKSTPAAEAVSPELEELRNRAKRLQTRRKAATAVATLPMPRLHDPSALGLPPGARRRRSKQAQRACEALRLPSDTDDENRD